MALPWQSLHSPSSLRRWPGRTRPGFRDVSLFDEVRASLIRVIRPGIFTNIGPPWAQDRRPLPHFGLRSGDGVLRRRPGCKSQKRCAAAQEHWLKHAHARSWGATVAGMLHGHRVFSSQRFKVWAAFSGSSLRISTVTLFSSVKLRRPSTRYNRHSPPLVRTATPSLMAGLALT